MANGSARFGGLLAMALVCASRLATASTTVDGGLIDAPTTWTAAASPYDVTGDLTVTSTGTLTIEPGVTVVFGEPADGGSSPIELTIEGTFIADGTAPNPITFQGASPTRDGWAGIAVEADAVSVSLTHATVSDCATGIVVLGGAPRLSDVAFSDVGTGVSWQAAGTVSLDTLSVSNFSTTAISLADDGVHGLTAFVKHSMIQQGTADAIGISAGARVLAAVSQTVITSSGTGVVGDATSSVTLVNDLIAGNALSGVFMTQTAAAAFNLVNDTIDHNGGAGIEILESAPGTVVLRNDIITSNVVGVEVIGSATALPDSNDVWNNATDYSGVTEGAHSLSVDPRYVGPELDPPAAGDYDYHLRGASPCIGAGDSRGAPSVDLDGFPRPWNGGFDLGAYQFHSVRGTPPSGGVGCCADAGSSGVGNVIDGIASVADTGDDAVDGDTGCGDASPSDGSDDSGCSGGSSDDSGCSGDDDGSDCDGGSAADCTDVGDGCASSAGRAGWMLATGLLIKRQRRRRRVLPDEGLAL